MGLITGNNGIQEQMQNTYTDEQQRKLKLGMIINRLRRYWRLFCLAGFIIASVVGCVNAIGTNNSFLAIIALAALGFVLIYVVGLYVYLYILAGRTIQLFLYLRDLFGGSKQTRI